MEGRRRLTLVVSEGGNGRDCDHVSWAEPVFVLEDRHEASPPTSAEGVAVRCAAGGAAPLSPCTGWAKVSAPSAGAGALAGLVLLAAVLRLMALERAPLPIYQDELSNIYDATCLAETGADRWGTRHPVLLRAFGDLDYRPAAAGMADRPADEAGRVLGRAGTCRVRGARHAHGASRGAGGPTAAGTGRRTPCRPAGGALSLAPAVLAHGPRGHGVAAVLSWRSPCGCGSAPGRDATGRASMLALGLALGSGHQCLPGEPSGVPC